jgi:hypothetical protein
MDKTRLVCLFVGLFVIGFALFPEPALAGVGVTPNSLSFGTVSVNSTSTGTLVVTNYSNQTITLFGVQSSSPQFVVGGLALPLTIGPHRSVSIQVAFHPTAAIAYTGTITFNAGRRSWQNANAVVSGTGATAAGGGGGTGTGPQTTPQATYTLSTSATGVTFGNQLVGSSASRSINVTNTGTGNVTISSAACTGAGFSVSGFSGAVTLTPGQALSLVVAFTPAAAGNVSGTLSVASTATNSPSAVLLSGAGVQPLIAVTPSSVSFGKVVIGATNTSTVIVQNSGSATLQVTQVTTSGTPFSLSGVAVPFSVAAGGAASFNAQFAPSTAGNFSGSLSISSNGSTSPLTVPIAGTGVAATYQLSLSPTSLNFGSLTTGSSTTQTVTLTNTGNSAVSISQIAASGTGFSVSTLGSFSLAPGQATSFSVGFAPSAAGSFTGSVAVTNNATSSPLVMALSGNATVSHSVNLSWSPGTSTYSGFNVYRGTTSGGPYTKLDSSLIAAPSYQDLSVTSGQTYYYVATEVDSTGTESSYSNEAIATIP